MKYFLVYIVFFLFSFCFSQVDHVKRVSDCYGASSILNPGVFDLAFPGDGGYMDDFAAYPSLQAVPELNSIWVEFTAPFDGVFQFVAVSKEEPLQAFLFKSAETDVCSKIHAGGLAIARFIRNTDKDSIGLRKESGPGFLYPIELAKEESVYMAFVIASNKKCKMQLKVSYEPLSVENVTKELIKKFDNRHNFDFPELLISVRDASSGLPVKCQLVFADVKAKTAMYRGSDFSFDVEKSGRIRLSIDAEGYFFYDREDVISDNSDQEIVVWLEPIQTGKQIEIKGIEFNMGTSEFSPGAEVPLRRLRDFLILNSEIRIEIQGHVHAVGDNSLAGKRLSQARAKRVMNYLVDSGIDKKRLTAVGYGNEFMKYPKPQFAYEEQANRRVEIKILEIIEE
jgi:outer membrane protein OmpA-like peptidoglycan-associated protein